MKTILIAAAAALLSCSAYAAESATTGPTKQQGKMASCNKEAGDKKGDERKAYMKECLSANAKPTQQTKMKTCNVEAKGKTGDERKAFMKDCLSAKG